jgi:hypothetical protein
VEEANNNVDGLIEAVQAAFVLFEPKKLNFSFLTLQGCLEEIILLSTNGDKNYKIPLIGNATLERAGILPDKLAAGEEAARTLLDDLF